MAAGKADLYIEQGAKFSVRLTLTDAEGNRRNLTGRTFKGQIRKSASASEVLATFSFTQLDQTQTGTRGQIDVKLTKEQTKALPTPTSSRPERRLAEYAYDIFSTDGAGDDVRELEGIVTVSPEVTRDV